MVGKLWGYIVRLFVIWIRRIELLEFPQGM